MASQYKTRCPHCGAQFRVGREHLQQAGGKVRCGSCLEVFRATEHLVETPGGSASPGQSATTATRRSQQTPPKKTPQKKAPPKKAPAKKKPATGPAASSGAAGAGKSASDATGKPPSGGKDSTSSSTPRWTLDDSTSAAPPAETKGGPSTPPEDRNDTSVSLDGLELSDSFLKLDQGDTDQLGGETFSDMAGAGEGKVSDDVDESWAEELLQELGDEDSGAAKSDTGRGADRTDAAEAPEPSGFFDEEPGAQQDAEPAGLPDEAPEEEPSGLFDEEPEPLAASGEDEDDFFSLLDEAGDDFSEIEIPAEPKKDRPVGTESATADILKWGALSLLAALVLVGQYLAFHFDDLARTPQWRDFYAGTCELIGCTLPHPTDARQLRGANLVVRSHPRVEDALVVDAILFNEATYEQPFPMLELDFTSLEGQSVASRRFLPEEYLTGELSNAETMPRDTPVRISFEIMDPGPEAVNYRMRLHPAPRDGAS